MSIRTHPNDIKERLSIAYVTAVAARAGCQVSFPPLDKQSIDLTVRPISGSKISVDLQLKATSQDAVRDESVVIALPVKNYDDLRSTRSTALHFLVVLVLEQADSGWLHNDEDALLIRKCAYWIDLRGHPPTNNETTINVEIPRRNIFDVVTMTAMMNAAYERVVPIGAERE